MKIKLYPSAVRKLTEAQLKAIKMTAEEARTEIIEEQVIPFDEGTLQNIQTDIDAQAIKSGVVSIVHDTPYAARLYYHPEYDFQKDNNPNARGLWWEEWLNGSKKERIRDIYKEFLKASSSGYIK